MVEVADGSAGGRSEDETTELYRNSLQWLLQLDHDVQLELEMSSFLKKYQLMHVYGIKICVY